VRPLDDGPSDEEILANTSEDDGSSVSSKGDPEESPVRSRQMFEFGLWGCLEILPGIFISNIMMHSVYLL